MAEKDRLNAQERFFFEIKIFPTEPKTPLIVGFVSAKHEMMYGGEIPEQIHRIILLNKSIFLKSEFVKSSFRTIEKCYKEYSNSLEDGIVAIRPWEFYPALKEIDSLLFELGSILDFFAREINFAYNLGINLRNISFGTAVRELRNKHSDLQITQKVLSFSESKTYIYFRKMRNMVTHRLPFQVLGRNTQLFFPDDPDSDQVTPSTDENYNVYETCRKWLYEILAFVDKTSLILFRKMARYQIIDKETGEELNIDEYYKRTREFVTDAR